jgi:nitrite reductase (NO-forming)
VVGTQFTLWPTVLRTRIVSGVEWAVRWSLPPLALGLAAAAVGLATQHRAVALAGLCGYAAGLAVALVPFVRTAVVRPPHTAASWMLGAGMTWFAVAVAVDLAALAGSQRVVELDGQLGRLVPAVAAGFALQTLTGALTYLLPVVFGRGAFGNRRLSGILDLAWPLRVVAVNLGVALLVAWPAGEWVSTMGWWLAGLGLGSFVPLAAAALLGSHLRTAGAA